jgi:hypothetical protein
MSRAGAAPAPPLVTFKDTVRSEWTEVVDNKERLLLYAGGIPIVGRNDRASKRPAAATQH